METWKIGKLENWKFEQNNSGEQYSWLNGQLGYRELESTPGCL